MASLMQLGALLRRRRAEGVSALTWGMFALANVCLYLTIGEWGRPQVIATTLGSALVQAIVVGLVLRLRADKRRSERTGDARA
jgi:peptidoglycan/LPS O-acetylase OafA/YrhL